MRVGINGFGRIGRVSARVLLERGMDLVHINDPCCDSSLIAQALRSDSVYGGVAATVSESGGDEVTVISDVVDWQVRVTSSAKADTLDWQCDAIIDASNSQSKAASWRTHSGPRRIILAGHDPTADGTFVLGASATAPTGMIWAASTCDAVAIAPVLKQLGERANITAVAATIVHPALSYQRVLDLWPPPMAADNSALSRSVLNNIIPHETSVKRAMGSVLPSLADCFSAMSFRVPTDAVCMATLFVRATGPIDHSAFLEAIRRTRSPLGVLDYTGVSRDFVRNSHSAIVIAPLTTPVNGQSLQVVIAYDNEWGYASRLADLLTL